MNLPTSHRKLSMLMFLQYAVEGVWLPIAARYLTAPVATGGLGYSAVQVGLVLGVAGSVGAISGPFIAGQVADRHISAERFMAITLLLGGLIRWFLSYQTSMGAWIVLSVLYSMLYSPTMALSNSIAFSHLKDVKREFPPIRVWGTIGWLVASWVFPMVWLQTGMDFQWKPPFLVGTELPNVTARLADALKFSAGISVLYALYCLTLPQTLPQKSAAEKFALRRVLVLFKQRPFLVLFLISLPVSVAHRVYYMQDGPFLSAIGLRDSDIMPAASLAQMGEIFVMATLGMLIAKLGFRKVIFLGAFALFARYAIFGFIGLPVPVIVSAHLLHGICFSCFFGAGQIYVDRIAPKDVRHSAQTLFGLFCFGLGPILGGLLSGVLEGIFEPLGPVQKFMGIWYTVAAIGLITSIVFLMFFKPKTEEQKGN